MPSKGFGGVVLGMSKGVRQSVLSVDTTNSRLLTENDNPYGTQYNTTATGTGSSGPSIGVITQSLAGGISCKRTREYMVFDLPTGTIVSATLTGKATGVLAYADSIGGTMQIYFQPTAAAPICPTGTNPAGFAAAWAGVTGGTFVGQWTPSQCTNSAGYYTTANGVTQSFQLTPQQCATMPSGGKVSFVLSEDLERTGPFPYVYSRMYYPTGYNSGIPATWGVIWYQSGPNPQTITPCYNLSGTFNNNMFSANTLISQPFDVILLSQTGSPSDRQQSGATLTGSTGTSATVGLMTVGAYVGLWQSLGNFNIGQFQADGIGAGQIYQQPESLWITTTWSLTVNYVTG